MTDPTTRFSSRVENYVKYRPGYPALVLETLREECGLTQASIIADIGSGTGLLTELFLRNGNHVFGVEPNDEMRTAGEALMRSYAGFTSVAGRAEATGLPDHSVDFVTAGQAFHWFDRGAARTEFARVLRPAGWAALVWNERETGATPFLTAYEALLERFATDYAQVDHRNVDSVALEEFFGAGGLQTRSFAYTQEFDLAGVQGRLLSSSYAPEAGHPAHTPMLAELKRIYGLYAVNDRVDFRYITRLYYGRLAIRSEAA